MRTASIWGGGDKLDMEQREVRYQLGPTRHCWIPITVSDCKGSLLPFPSSLLHITSQIFGEFLFWPILPWNHTGNRCLGNTVPSLTKVTRHNSTTSQQCNDTDIIIPIFKKSKPRSNEVICLRLHKSITRSVTFQSL